MKNPPTINVTARSVAMLFVLAVFVFGFAGVNQVLATELPSGVVVKTSETTGRNQIWIQIGDDMLAVDAVVGDATEIENPKFGKATGAGAAIGAEAELRPESRKRPDESAVRTTIIVRSGFTLTGGGRDVVFIDVGRAATAGDAVVWFPGEKLLLAGRICDRDRIEASADSDTVAWADTLDRLLDLEPAVVIPGRGAPGGAELLSAQADRLAALRAYVEDGLLANRSAAETAASFDEAWYTRWHSKDPTAAEGSIRAVFAEVGGLHPPWELIEDRHLREGPSPTRNDPGWTKPRKVLWRNYWPDRLPMLAQVAPGVEIVPFDTTEEAMASIGDADALIGAATADLLAAAEKLRWVQVGSAGVERYLTIPELSSGEVLLTNGQRLASPVIGEHVMALTRGLARGLNRAISAQDAGRWQRSEIADSAPLTQLRGKTMLVVGLGGIGTEVARLASAAGMRVTAIRNSRRSGPPFVAKVGLGEDLVDYLGDADVVANCLPLTPETRGQFDAVLFDAMKPTAFFVNVGRGGTVVTADLVDALEQGKIAGAGLDVTDPEPLPEDHPLWKAPNLIITPHFAAWSDAGRERRWLLYRENLRRFVAGERLLSVVNPERGY